MADGAAQNSRLGVLGSCLGLHPLKRSTAWPSTIISVTPLVTCLVTSSRSRWISSVPLVLIILFLSEKCQSYQIQRSATNINMPSLFLETQIPVCWTYLWPPRLIEQLSNAAWRWSSPLFWRQMENSGGGGISCWVGLGNVQWWAWGSWVKQVPLSRIRELLMSLSWFLTAPIRPNQEPGLLVPSAVSDPAEDVLALESLSD